MAVHVFGCNHIVLEVGDLDKAIEFYTDVFNLEPMNEGEGDAFFQLGNHQFLALFQSDDPHVDNHRHFGLMVRDDAQVAEIREKISEKYGLKPIPPFRCDFHDPWGNRIQVVDMHDESTAWLQPYEEVQKVGAKLPD
jgi:catechol 2,3-dioxygenase-like lactoylglutathione lyase family enzyme